MESMSSELLRDALKGEAVLVDEGATQALGAELAAVLPVDATVLLEGPLGAGKTCLVRGLLRAMGFEGSVKSPTFVLMVEYDLGVRVVHADFYRLATAAGTEIEEELGEALCLIEWPDRLEALVDPERCWRVSLTIVGDHRTARVRPPVG